MAQTCSTCTRPATHYDADDRPTVYCGRCAAKWGRQLTHRMRALGVLEPLQWEELDAHPAGAVRWLQKGTCLFEDFSMCSTAVIALLAREPVLIAGFATKLHGGVVAVIDASGRAGFVRVPNLLTEKRRKERLNNST